MGSVSHGVIKWGGGGGGSFNMEISYFLCFDISRQMGWYHPVRQENNTFLGVKL
jgi:hypothetical protein